MAKEVSNQELLERVEAAERKLNAITHAAKCPSCSSTNLLNRELRQKLETDKRISGQSPFYLAVENYCGSCGYTLSLTEKKAAA